LAKASASRFSSAFAMRNTSSNPSARAGSR
jgi:hypothetical protein